MTTQKRGIVTNVEFTSGGAGNQWTTIDGVKYATWWDIRTKDWKVGDTVTFDAGMTQLWSDNPPIPGASNIHKVTATTATIDEQPDTQEPWTPIYTKWRHGGWYVTNVHYPSGACGCVSNNYDDRKWRIVCGQDHSITYPSRDAAARAEREIAFKEAADIPH
jgi:hypothetical protein